MRVSITTLGCKVNQYETGALETMLRMRGHSVVPHPNAADACIINTCAVTAESGRKSRQAIRRAKLTGPGAIIAVCGCFSQVSTQEIRDLGADLVYGSGERTRFLEDLERVFEGRVRIERVEASRERHGFEMLPAGGLSGRTRAMLKIQDGCDNFCAYCIIPYARGPVRSMPLEDAAREAQRLAGEGFREIVITGIEISSYGRDLDGKPDLLELICRISPLAAGARLRLGSLEPRMVTEEFCGTVAALPNVCRHFHLSLQSGCGRTLKRMGRKYSPEQFYESVRLLREAMPGCAVTADLIVGFPGETEAEFVETMAFIRRCDFSSMHVFPYSVRSGTAAAKMEGQMDKKTKAARAEGAKAAADEMRRRYLAGCVGETLEVLFETEKDGLFRGHAGNYAQVAAKGENLKNRLVPVLVTGVNNEILCGEVRASV